MSRDRLDRIHSLEKQLHYEREAHEKSARELSQQVTEVDTGLQAYIETTERKTAYVAELMNVEGVSEGEEPQVGGKADETKHSEGDKPSGELEIVVEPEDELANPRMSYAIGYLPERLDKQSQPGVNLVGNAAPSSQPLASGKTTSP